MNRKLFRAADAAKLVPCAESTFSIWIRRIGAVPLIRKEGTGKVHYWTMKQIERVRKVMAQAKEDQ